MRIDKFSTRNEKLRAAYRLVSICNRENFVMRHEPYLVKDNNGYGKPMFRLYYPSTPDDMMTGVRQFWENMSKLAPDIDPSILKFVPSNENEYYAYAFETNKRTDTPYTCYMIEDGYDDAKNLMRIKEMEKKLRNDRKERAEEMEELSKQTKMKEYEEEIPTRKHYKWTFPTEDFTEKEISDAALKAQKSNESFFIEDNTHMQIFEELVQNDNSTDAKIRRYLERKEKERKERYDRMLHPSDKEGLQDIIIEEIKKKGPNVDLNHIDVSEIEDMSMLFTTYYKEKITDFDGENSKILRTFAGDISKWDTSSVTNMRCMFIQAKDFNCDISKWDVSSVEQMDCMFMFADNFNQPIGGWDVSNVEDMNGMFYYAKKFNYPLNDWNISNVTNFGGMFCGAESFDQPLNNWGDKFNSKAKINMNSMFNSASNFRQNISNWKVDNVDKFGRIFTDCPIDDSCKPEKFRV